MSSTSVPAIWYYRNESGFLVIHMDTGVERGLMMMMMMMMMVTVVVLMQMMM